MALTLVNSYKVEALTSGNTALVTGAFTPAVGDLLVIKIANGDADQTLGTPVVTGFTITGGSFTSRLNVGTSGSSCRAAIFTAFVATSASGTVSSGTFTNNRERAMVVEHWSGAQLAATPATASFVADVAAPFTATITTAQAGSKLSYVLADWAGGDPAGRAFVGDTTAPVEEQAASYASTFLTVYWLTQAAASAGSHTWGMSAPASTYGYTAGCIEIQDSGGGGPQTYNVPVDDVRGLTDQLITEYTPGPGVMVWTKSVGIG